MRLLIGLMIAAALLFLLWGTAQLRPGRPDPTTEIRTAGSTSSPDARPEVFEVPTPVDEAGVTFTGRVTGRTDPAPARVQLTRLGPAPDEPPATFRRFATRAGVPGAGTIVGMCRTGAEGRFVLTGPGSGRYLLRAEGENAASTEREVKVPVGQRSVEVHLALPCGAHVLRGRVRYADGRPFAGTILARRMGGIVASSAVRGSFALGGLEEGHVRLSFRVSGQFRSGGPTAYVPADGPLDLVVDPGSEPVEGRVLDATTDAPIAGAEIHAYGRGPARRDIHHRVRTGADGKFQVRIPRRYRSVTVFAEGYWPASIGAEVAEARPEIRLEPTGRVTGIVVEAESGAPLPGVLVTLVAIDGVERYGRSDRVSVRTGSDGRFVFPDVPALEAMAFVLADGWMTRGLADVRPDGVNPLSIRLGPGAARDVRIEVEAAAAVEGRVLDVDGSPPARTAVHAQLVRPGRVPYESWVSESCVTDEDGRFRFESFLPRRQYRIQGWGPGAWVTTGEGGSVVRVEIRRLARPSAEVRVVDADTGRPIAGARVTPFDGKGRISGMSLTDGEGRAGVAWPWGSLGVGHPEYRPSPKVVIPPGTPLPSRIEVSLHPGVSIRGFVVLPDGSPSPGGSVTAGGHRAPIGFGGEFRLTGVPAGEVEVWARVELESGERVEGRGVFEAGADSPPIRLEPAEDEGQDPERSGIEVRARGPDGTPVVRAVVWVWALERTGDVEAFMRLPFHDGRAVFDYGDEYESVWILVRDARTATGVPLPLGSAMRGPLRPDAGRIEVRLPEELAISGTVRAADGTPIPRTTVQAVHLEPYDLGGRWITGMDARTDESGAYRIGGLGAGTYDLRAVAPEGLGLVRERRARAGQTGVDLVLGSEVRVAIRVLGPDGTPVSGARVVARFETPRGPAEGRPLRGETGKDGRAALTGLVEGARYGLEVRPYDEDLAPARLDGWVPGPVEIRLPPGHSVRGRVEITAGAVAAAAAEDGVQVWFRSRGTDWDFWDMEKDGTFHIGSLPEGPVRLVARTSYQRPEDDPPDAVVVPTGARDVVLRCMR